MVNCLAEAARAHGGHRATWAPPASPNDPQVQHIMAGKRDWYCLGLLGDQPIMYETDMGNDSTPGHNPKNPDSHFPLATPSFTQNALRVYEALSALLPPIMVPGLYLHAARMQLLPAGDLVGLGTNGMNVLCRWDKSMRPAIDSIRAAISSFDYYDSNGELRDCLPYAPGDLLNVEVVQMSGLIDLLYGKAKDCGIDLRFGAIVCDYWESEGNAGIVKATGTITGKDVAPYSTGAAIYRSHFDSREIRDDPEANWILDSTGRADHANMYLGKDTTLLVGTVGKARHPLSPWVSKGGRMIVIGDAAHAMHPNLGQGANMAIEDAAVVATCLELCGKKNMPVGLRVVEKLRQKRVLVVEAASIKAMERQFDANWDTDQAHGKPTYDPRPAWLLRHDCVRHTYDEHESAALAVASRSEYIPTNAPLNGVYDEIPELA
ncbi:hypothetical protein KXV98_009378 [Aspergillus fumigatus]|nr:hypothetical protein KXV98_009378 [Aspergillus fumigatus]KAH3299589.1 hypothetical protein KXV19_009356 [Aspergillus fumigatus]KAJ8235602.1 hypothetical protein LV156_004022 [Aspergillus fumigatus]KAJ8238392.1 hypothetical protein LV160_004383 [Aspergillus fumigatus]